jgi:hypothetical protein
VAFSTANLFGKHSYVQQSSLQWSPPLSGIGAVQLTSGGLRNTLAHLEKVSVPYLPPPISVGELYIKEVDGNLTPTFRCIPG